MNFVELETPRLRLRHWREADFDTYADYYQDEANARFVGGVCSREDAWRRMAAVVGHWVLRGHGYWAVEDKETGNIVGSVGLWRPEGWQELELGYWLTANGQGKGYATEAGKACKDYAKDVLKSESLVSYIDPDNHASKLVAERLGARYEKTIELVTFGPHCVYRYW